MEDGEEVARTESVWVAKKAGRIVPKRDEWDPRRLAFRTPS
jgi:hypothetical protein